ncbi:hypothetical protein KJ786_03560 [Patescibacteria group bacterium]|nr:hypothetical protein [Patescibacteria group bacterium]
MKKIILVVSLVAISVGLIGFTAFSEVQAENQSEIDKAINYLELQSSDPWITMGLIAGGKTDTDLNYLKTLSGSSATDYEKIILAITAAGENPRTFGDIDFVSQLESFYQNNQIGSTNYLNDDFWGILALVSAGEDSSSQIIQDSKNFILTNQNPDGGFPFGIGWGSDVDDTAAAIMALLESGTSSSDPVIIKAVDYLKSCQNSDGGFPYDPVSPWGTDSNASSDAWVISAIYKLGQNPSDWSKNGKNPIDNLKSLQISDGSFEKYWPFPSSTAYAVIALSQKFYPVGKYSVSIDSSGGGVRMYVINASASEHGLIFFSGMVRVGATSDEAFTISPDTGYHVEDVLVDGVSVGTVTSYTFNNIDADHTISVSFAVDPPQSAKKSGDINSDNIINEYDFAVLREDWGQPGLGLADLNHDGAINEYDFALLMFNWDK